MNRSFKLSTLKKKFSLPSYKKYQDCIIFDCDGVLVDSESIMQKLYVGQLARLGFLINEIEYAQMFAGASLEYMQRVVYEKRKIVVPDTFFEFDHDDEVMTQLQPLTKNVLRFTHQMNIDRCIASNNIKSKIEHLLRKSNIDHFFRDHHIFTAQQAGKSKPEPDLFLLAAECMKKNPNQCIVIEDSPFGIQAALSAGMRVIGFLVAPHTHYESYKKNITQYSVPVVYSEKELMHCLRQMLR